jgi:hypothetical protein
MPATKCYNKPTLRQALVPPHRSKVSIRECGGLDDLEWENGHLIAVRSTQGGKKGCKEGLLWMWPMSA